ncbi:polyprenyl glycosylphosphotransferase [Fervidobacterium thailandense]|uniref:Polyprenyl glycosylphosphotransferase n=1 Tax=Fervidobacterium thailandense TaxID=1008305 RepID=A0A1E3G0T1_9BACT|nr:polyprenyl glycosylphosphotransferase [Fervidobacterium thailandense]
MLILVSLLTVYTIFFTVTKNILIATFASVIWVITAYAFRTFEFDALESLNEQLVRILVSSFFSGMFILLPELTDTPNFSGKQILKGLLYTYFATPFLNYVLYNFLFLRLSKPRHYLVIGRKEEEVGRILDEITEKSRGKIVFEEFLNPSPAVLKVKLDNFNDILVADFELYKRVKHILEPYKSSKKIEYLSDLSEKILRRIPLEVVDRFREYYEIEFENAKESPTKRILDMFGAILGLVFFAPIILIAAVAILIEDGPPVVFKQLRVGKNNKEFMIVKLRSMKKQTDGQARFADQEKDRILKIGKIIRPTRIDEALQFWNILKGDMSLVGPRPEQIPFVREFEQKIPYYSYRHKLKPGLTGWAQIMYQYSSTLEEVKRKLEYDLYYIKNRSTLMDLRIILQTIEAVFWRRGAK